VRQPCLVIAGALSSGKRCCGGFLLIAGDIFLRRLVEILPRFKDKRQAVDISQQIEADISAYLTTITLMNLGVGVATGIVTAACGVGDPVLWGTVAFLLNYVPILGPMIGVTILVFASLLSIETLWLAFVPAGVYVLIHVVEGETITPMLLARRFTINPVLVILSLVFWYGCGAFLVRFSLCRCWLLPRSSATVSSAFHASAEPARAGQQHRNSAAYPQNRLDFTGKWSVDVQGRPRQF